MNRRAILIGTIYCICVIAFKLFIVLGGYGLTKFGFNYSQVVSVFGVIPFIVLAIYLQRKENGGYIAGKSAMGIGLTIVLTGAVVLSVYNYIEFEYLWKQLSIKYYSSKEFYQSYLDYYTKHPNEKKVPFSEVVYSNLVFFDAFRAVTVRLFSFMLIGLSSAFICAVVMKRGPKKVS